MLLQIIKGGLFIFFKYILLIMLLQLPHFPLFTPLYLAPPLLSTFPPFSSWPWVIHISSLASTFPILFLPSPCLFSTYHLCYSFSVPFPPSPPPTPLLITLHVVSISVVLFLFQLFAFAFVLGMVVNNCEFAVILLFIFLSSFSQINPFNISYNKGLVMMNSFNLTLSEAYFICPSILNESFAGQSNLGCRSLPFITWNTSFQPLLACKFSFEKSADSLVGTPL